MSTKSDIIDAFSARMLTIEIRPGVTCASSMGGVFADPSAALAALDDYLADDPEALGLGSR